MTGRDIFKIWAPSGLKWSPWVRPVPFVSIKDTGQLTCACNFVIPKVCFIHELKPGTAIILDLPDYESIPEGLALAKLGYRPIPLYNGTEGQEGAMAIVENRNIKCALIWGASELSGIDIPDDAPPVFLLDSNRMHRYKMDISVFDNSWDLYDQDIPSPEFLLKNGIDKILIRGDSIQEDLERIFIKFQNKGFKIYFTGGYDEPKEAQLKPLKSVFNKMFYGNHQLL